MDSGMMNSLYSLRRSAWNLARLLLMEEEMASSSSPNREGTGPASRSPSKRSASRGQDLRGQVGMLSLQKARLFF